MKRILAFVGVILLAGVYSFAEENQTQNQNQEQQQAEEEQKSGANFGMGLAFGSATIDKKSYFQIRLQPDLSLGKFGIGLDINLEFDDKGKIRKSEWNSWQAVLSKIMYIRYGFKGDRPVYAKIGSINDFVLGHGFILYYYSNMMFYPQIRKLGIAFDLDLGQFGFESMVDNVYDFDLVGGRLFFRPLWNSGGFFKDLEFGATAVADLDPLNPAPDPEKPYDFTDSPDSKTVLVWGVDAGFPVVNLKSVFDLTLYADFAQISGRGSGEAFGFYGSVISIIGYRFEVRYFGKEFIAPFFDNYYDAQRNVQVSSNLIISKYDSLTNYTDGYAGWLFTAGTSLFDGKFTASLQVDDSFSDDILPHLVFRAEATRELLKKFRVALTFDRKNIESFADAFKLEDEDSISTLEIGYMVSENLEITVTYRKTFRSETDENGNERVVASESTFVSTKLVF